MAGFPFQTPEVSYKTKRNAKTDERCNSGSRSGRLEAVGPSPAASRRPGPRLEDDAGMVLYQDWPPRLVAGELGLEPDIQLRAISAASSFAPLTFLPSYQKRAEMVCP